ncbi:MAG: asparagine synthase-related protein [Ignisphaera sp.]
MRFSMPCTIYSKILFNVIRDVIEKRKCDCIALSGGIDTTVVLIAALSAGVKPRGYIAIYSNGLPRDLIYVEHLAKIFNIETRYVFIDKQKEGETVQDIVRCIGKERIDSHGDGGCIEIRNDLVFYSVLRKAFEDGCKCIYTGSGGDEIFAGYTFLLTLTGNELEEYIKRLANGRYPEIELAKCIGIDAVAPFLDEAVLNIALQTPLQCLRTEAMKGKEILREILYTNNLHLIAERMKTPAESGAGTTAFCKSIYDT